MKLLKFLTLSFIAVILTACGRDKGETVSISKDKASVEGIYNHNFEIDGDIVFSIEKVKKYYDFDFVMATVPVKLIEPLTISSPNDVANMELLVFSDDGIITFPEEAHFVFGDWNTNADSATRSLDNFINFLSSKPGTTYNLTFILKWNHSNGERNDEVMKKLRDDGKNVCILVDPSKRPFKCQLK